MGAALTSFRNAIRQCWYSRNNLVRNHIQMSLILQILLYLGMYYAGLVTFMLAFLLFMKYLWLPYPGVNLASESMLLLFFGLVESSRVYLGMKGNVMHELLPLAISMALILPSLMSTLYFMLWQTYVLRIEVVLSVVLLAMQGMQLLFASFCLHFIRTDVSLM